MPPYLEHAQVPTGGLILLRPGHLQAGAARNNDAPSKHAVAATADAGAGAAASACKLLKGSGRIAS